MCYFLLLLINMENLKIIWAALFSYTIFALVFSMGLLIGERYACKRPNCKFTYLWRKYVIKKS